MGQTLEISDKILPQGRFLSGRRASREPFTLAMVRKVGIAKESCSTKHLSVKADAILTKLGAPQTKRASVTL